MQRSSASRHQTHFWAEKAPDRLAGAETSDLGIARVICRRETADELSGILEESSLSGMEVDPFSGASVLGVLREVDRAYLAQRSRRRQIAKGQILLCEGDPSDSVLVLLSGQMKVVTYSPDGAEFILNTVLPGDTIGEIGMLSGRPRSATVQAVAPSVVLTLPSSVVVELIEQRPALAIALLQRLSNMLRRTSGVASDLVHLDLTQRVAKYLLHNADKNVRDARVAVTQTELAANIGASRQRVNSCLREFQKRGWIAMESRQMRVLDQGALTGIVNRTINLAELPSPEPR